MADLILKIKASTEEASKAFKDLAGDSEVLQKKIKKLSEDMGKGEADRFIQQQKLAGVAMQAVGKDIEGLTKQHDAYEKKIQDLIKKGVDPESEAIRKLQSELANTDKALAKHGKYQGDAKKGMDMMANAAKAGAAALAALGAATAAAVQATAEAGDHYAKTARLVGMSAESFQELEYAATQSGVSSESLKSSLEKLNKSVGDVKNGTGALTKYLGENNPELLEQVKNVKSNEEAFELLMGAIKDCPDEFERATLSQAAFGKSGQELYLIAENGADGIAALREEARKYGVITNESAKASEEFIDAQGRLKAALNGAKNEMVAGLIPGITDGINKVADFISNIDNLSGVLETAVIIIAGVTAAFVAFMVVAKAQAIIQGIAGAFHALTAAMAANPIGLIVAAVALLVTGLILLYKNWDMVQTSLQKGIARLKFAFQWLGSVIEEGLVVAFNSVKSAGASLLDFIIGNIIRGVGQMLDLFSALPFGIGDMFKTAADTVKGLGNAIGDMAERTREDSRAAIQAAHEKQDAISETLSAELAAVAAASAARREDLRKRKQEDEVEAAAAAATSRESIALARDTEERIGEERKKAAEKAAKEIKLSFAQELDRMDMSTAGAQNEAINTIKSFLKKRADLERAEGEDRIAFYEAMGAQIRENDALTAEQRVAAEMAVAEAVAEIRGKMADELQKQAEKERQEAKRLRKEELARLKEQEEERKRIVVSALEAIGQTEAQILAARQGVYSKFLSERLEAEGISGAKTRDEIIRQGVAQKDYLRQQGELVAEELKRQFEARLADKELEEDQRKELQARYDEERLAAEIALSQMIISIGKETEKNVRAYINSSLDTVKEVVSEFKNASDTLSSIFEDMGKENIAFAILSKSLASAQALINSLQAFTKVLAESGPFGIAKAAVVLAAGLGAQAKIWATPIPTAETGASFLAPDFGTRRVDGGLVRINAGERIDISPRGMGGEESVKHFIFNVENQTIFDVVNRGLRNGDIYEVSPAWNL